MGTTYVTLTRDTSGNEPGFWMRDAVLELWLRLLSLHLPEPTDGGEHAATTPIRNQWLLASRGYFQGCVPHGMENACANAEGIAVVREAIGSLMTALRASSCPLDPDTLNLLGIEGTFQAPLDRNWLLDVGAAFLDLLDGKIGGNVRSTEIMPGTHPYPK